MDDLELRLTPSGLQEVSCPSPLADAGLNPFSFKEFLRWKALDPDQEQDPGQDPGQEQVHSQVRSSVSRTPRWALTLPCLSRCLALGAWPVLLAAISCPLR